MFTGIVEEAGRVRAVSPSGLSISAQIVLSGARLGDSMAVNGACLTINRVEEGTFSVEVMPETWHRTNLGRLRPGDQVNLERPLVLGGRLGGHLVQGHIDATGQVLALKSEGEAQLVRLSASPSVMRYIVEKGFIAVDGVSLTVVARDSHSFQVSLVSYTRDHTNLGQRKPGDMVNLEVDIIAKYVESLGEARSSGITEEWLREQGFATR